MLRKIKKKIQDRLGITHIMEVQSMQSKKMEEILKSAIFNSTINNSKWLKYKSFSPGGWAVDYALLYTLYRVLNGMRPRSVLEFGLGQSSKMIHQYAGFFEGVKAITCEHDPDWVTFFKNDLDGAYDINIKYMELHGTTYKNEPTLTYRNMEKEFAGEQYDLILVDAPFGSRRYSRSQILDLIKTNLKPDFCIIMDDYDRAGEKETAQEVMTSLKETGVKCLTATYWGSKQHLLICSENLKFLTSL